MSLVVRTAVAPAGFLQTLSRAVRQVDPDIPMKLTGSTGSMSAVGTVDITSGLASRQFDAWLLGSFAASALVLAAIGIYGLLAYSVAQRRREIGIRLALGASGGDVLHLVVGDGLRLTAAGIAVGVLAALAVTRLLAALLYGVGASDPTTFVGVVVLLALVSLVASYLPARRAAKLDPMVALRSE
jgi:putative ABC transport system permease protein